MEGRGEVGGKREERTVGESIIQTKERKTQRSKRQVSRWARRFTLIRKLIKQV